MIIERNKKRIRSRHTSRFAFVRHVLIGGAWISGIALLLLGIYHVTRVETFLISEVVVEGGMTISSDAVRDDILQELRGAYWRLIPHAFALTYPYDRIVERLEAHPRLQAAVLTRDGLKRLTVSFTEYEPHALLCPRESTGESCYVMSEGGYAFEEAPQLQGGVLVRHIDDSLESVRRGHQFEIARMRAVETFIETAEDTLGFRISSVRYDESGDIDFYLNGGGFFKVNGNKDMQEALRDIQTVLETEEYAHLTPGNFQYIDVRFPPKVFVNDAPISVPTTTPTTTVTTTPSDA